MSRFFLCVSLCIIHSRAGARTIDFALKPDVDFSEGSHGKRKLQEETVMPVESNDAPESAWQTVEPFGAGGFSDSIDSIGLRRTSRSVLSKRKGTGGRDDDDDDNFFGGDDDDNFFGGDDDDNFFGGDDDEDTDDEYEHHYEYDDETSGLPVTTIVTLTVVQTFLVLCCCGCCWYHCRILTLETRQECVSRVFLDCWDLDCCPDPFDCVYDMLENALCCDFISWALCISRRSLSSGSSSNSDSSDSSSCSENRMTFTKRIRNLLPFQRKFAEACLPNEDCSGVEMTRTSGGSASVSIPVAQPINTTDQNNEMKETEHDHHSPRPSFEDKLDGEVSTSAALTDYQSVASFPSGNLDGALP